MAQRLPPFRDLLKSRDVEDPVNLWVHRPLAYGFVALIFRTPITPNMVTLLALVVGVTAGGLWLWGTPGAMLAGGILLWTSAILDGADGFLARAKNLHSLFGRALDGSADTVVAACTVVPAFWHIYVQHGRVLDLVLAVPAIALTVVHLDMYDFYKESYLRMTRPGRGGEGEDATIVTERLAKLEAEGGAWVTRTAVKHLLLPVLLAQERLVGRTNPQGLRDKQGRTTPETAEVFRRHNLGPMRLWAAISLAPHSYIMAICGMVDHLEVYLWIRLVLMNVLFVTVLIWQRRATVATNRALSELDSASLAAQPTT